MKGRDSRRRVTGAVVVTLLFVLVAVDLASRSIRIWWLRHAFTTDVSGSLLVVAVTALVFDEIIARRQRRDRAATIAVQALIVYTQVRRTYTALLGAGAADSTAGEASEEFRMLSSMILSAAPNLFDDPEARRFLEAVERFTGSMAATANKVAKSSATRLEDADRDRLTAGVAAVKALLDPLTARLSLVDSTLLSETGNDSEDSYSENS
jgi:hypothetical protein